MFPRLRLTR